VINLQPYNGSGYIGQADSMKGIGNFKGALQSYNQAISMDSRCRNQGMYKRAVLLYQLKNFEQSLIDFEQLLDENDKNAKAHYYKAKILKKQDHENEAILHFEQVIKYTTNNLGGVSPSKLDGEEIVKMSSVTGVADEELAGNALFEIAKIRINQRDFYEAFHNLQRAIHYDFRSKKFLQYKMFVEGVLFLMKRKVKKGVKMLTALIEGQSDVKELVSTSSPIDGAGGIKKLTGSQNTLPVPSKDQINSPVDP
jgi:tetratricopeptide (TPR) repeat protein